MQDETSGTLSISQVSKILGVAVDTIRRWDKKGKLKPIRLPSGHRRYRVADIEPFMPKRS